MPDYVLVKRLVSAILALRETHDHHGPRVAAMAHRLATAAGLPADQVELVETGAHLHDIGKVLIRKDLLNMPRKLTPEETAEMRLHAMYGWAIVEQSGFEPLICDVVRHHHERYDGNGYPDRLAGQQIPLAARIVGVCDTYEALVSQRSYRDAFSPSVARWMVESGQGTLFDPHLVDLFFAKVVPE
jgi:putative nucleotidyltransferase with HDIG domain